jgi:hypothetical protein
MHFIEHIEVVETKILFHGIRLQDALQRWFNSFIARFHGGRNRWTASKSPNSFSCRLISINFLDDTTPESLACVFDEFIRAFRIVCPYRVAVSAEFVR